MVGVVIVSHSARIAEGVAELAREMGGSEVRLETAGGLEAVEGPDGPEHPIGTDAVLVMQAIERAWSDDGVLVLMDLGSAVLSAEMAVDLIGDERRDRILLCEAPLVEGAVAAAVTAKLGMPLEAVAAEARSGLAGKIAHLATGEEGTGPTVAGEPWSESPARRRPRPCDRGGRVPRRRPPRAACAACGPCSCRPPPVRSLRDRAQPHDGCRPRPTRAA